MYKSKVIEELRPGVYDVDGSGLQYYATGGPNGPFALFPGRAPFSLMSSGHGIIERFRAGPHEDFGRDHINYETFAGRESRNTLLHNVHLGECKMPSEATLRKQVRELIRKGII